jgi:hypothetical protein
MATVLKVETAEDVRELIATLLAGAAGGSTARWKRLVGDVEQLPTWRFVRFNWRIEPSGTPAERATIAKAVDVVRAEHPYIG